MSDVHQSLLSQLLGFVGGGKGMRQRGLWAHPPSEAFPEEPGACLIWGEAAEGRGRPPARMFSHSRVCQGLSDSQQSELSKPLSSTFLRITGMLSGLKFLFLLFLLVVLSSYLTEQELSVSLLLHFRPPWAVVFIPVFIFQTRFLPIAGKGAL